MTNNYVVLQKERDFIQLFGDMLLFFKQNWKRLIYLIMIYAGPFLLIDGVISAYFNNFIYSNMTTPLYGGMLYDYRSPFDFLSDFFTWYLILIITKIIIYTFLSSLIYGYISIYAEKGPGFDLNDVRPVALSYFFPFMLAGFVVMLIVMVGIIFCIVPGIYLGVCLSFIFVVMIIEKKSFGDAFSRSFNIAHKDFWMTLLLMLAVAVGLMLVGVILQLPMTGSNMMMFVKKATGQEASQSFSIINMILITITTIIMSVLTIFPIIATSLQYFNITEKEKRINQSRINPVS